MTSAEPPSGASAIREGILTGLVGAAALALWFLIVDVLAGRPFHTPAALGAGLFRGVRAAEAAAMPEGAPALVAGYTVFHALVFVAAGVILSHVVAMVEHEPAIILLAGFALFVFFEFSYFVFALVFVQRVLAEISWPALLVGNAVAAFSMGGFLYSRHPRLHFKLQLKLDA
ncbi:MAG: hypothetical protein HY705_02195 [Gemmatimonadetes bacterium]|nr:hypothetical protein [Gemmatimonadota bacterium]